MWDITGGACNIMKGNKKSGNQQYSYCQYQPPSFYKEFIFLQPSCHNNNNRYRYRNGGISISEKTREEQKKTSQQTRSEERRVGKECRL